MARKISDEQIKLSIIIDGNPAQKAILDLEKSTIRLKQQAADLSKQEKAKRTEYEKSNKTYKENKDKLEELRTSYAELQVSSQKEIDALKKLEQQSGKTSAEYKAQAKVVDALYASGDRILKNQDKHFAAIKKLEPSVKSLSTEYKGVKEALEKTNTEIEQNQVKLKELTGALKINDMSMTQLKHRAAELAPVLAHLIPGSEDYKKYDADLKEVNARMAELKGNSKEAGFSIGGIADRFNRFAALGASVIATGTGIVLSIQKIIDFNSQLSDSQSNVMKTTGMTKREVDELTKSFGLLKTRTARIELLGIAEVGGRLGIAKEEMADFVKVMDKSAVALGDSFEGGPEVVADKLGKIKGLYDDLRNSHVETVFESVGSAINDLGADGTASEQNLAEFATRVGTLPGALKPTIQQALGLGAAFEESGLKAELAGNNYGKVISIAARDIGAFSTVMKRPVSEMKNLINTDPTEFFFQFAKSLKGLDATELAQVLDYLKLNDNEVKMVLGAASENVDLFRSKIDLASQSMADATSLTAEYDIKNNNLAATLERLKKKVIGWFTSDSIVAFLTTAVEKFSMLIGAVEDSDGAMNTLRNTLVFTAKILSIVVASLLSYTAGAKLAALWSNNVAKATAFSNIVFKIQYGMLVAQEVATKALALAKALLSFNIVRVRAAYQALSIAMGMNPFGALLAVIGAVIAAFVAFGGEADKTADIIKGQAEVMKQVADQTGKVKDKVSDLVAIMKDENATYDQKQKALEQLKKIGQGYLDTLTQENILTAEGKRLIDRYIKSIDQLATAKAMVNVKSKLMDQKMESDNKVLALSLEKKQNKNSGSAALGGEDGKFFGLGARNKMEIQIEMDEQKEAGRLIDLQLKTLDSQKKKEIDGIRKIIADKNTKLKGLKKDSQQSKELTQDIKAAQNSLDILIGLEDEKTSDAKSDIFIPGDKKAGKAAAKAKKEADKLQKDRMAELKKQIEELTELERQGIENRLNLLLDGLDKEEVLENERHRQKLQDLQKQMISEADITKAEKNMQNDKLSKLEQDYWTRQADTWVRKNEHLHNLIELEHGTHRLKLETIDIKSEEKRIANITEAFEKEKQARQTAHNYELAALGENVIKKEKLQQQFDKDELIRLQAHLEDLLKEKQKILADGNTGFNLDILSEDDRKKFEQEVADLKQKLSELMLAKQELAGKAGSNDIGKAARDVFGNTDILGFTSEQWERTFASIDTLSQKLAATNMVVTGLQNLWSAFTNYQNATGDAQIKKYEKNSDARKRKLKWELDNGYINQSQYNKRLEIMDAELEKKKAEIEYKQAKRQKQMALFDAIIGTARGVASAIPNVFLMGLAAAVGALQIATIQKQPLPARGYEKGLYPEYVQREQDGKIFKSTYGGKTRSGMVNKPTYFLAGEKGPEMVIDDQAYRDLSPETRYALENELRRIKGWQGGKYNENLKEPRYEVPAGSSAASSSSVSQEQLLGIIAQNTQVMQKLLDGGVVARYMRDYRDLSKMQEDLDKLKDSRNKAKQ